MKKLISVMMNWCGKHWGSTFYGLMTVLCALLAIGYAWISAAYGKTMVETFHEECDD